MKVCDPEFEVGCNHEEGKNVEKQLQNVSPLARGRQNGNDKLLSRGPGSAAKRNGRKI